MREADEGGVKREEMLTSISLEVTGWGGRRRYS